MLRVHYTHIRVSLLHMIRVSHLPMLRVVYTCIRVSLLPMLGESDSSICSRVVVVLNVVCIDVFDCRIAYECASGAQYVAVKLISQYKC